MTRHLVGIDLGTTHTALAYGGEGAGDPVRVFPIPQLLRRGELDRSPLLPSALCFPHPAEGHLPLPWDPIRRFGVGEVARSFAAAQPERVVLSAKSWLCHPTLDRRAASLPPSAPEDVERVSPVEASFRLLDHLVEAWRTEGPGGELSECAVVLAVPASFDASARELTVEAAYAAGLEELSLLEEPQAALQGWLLARGEDCREQLSPGDRVLVVDVGGGTTDFSLIDVGEEEGRYTFTRVAVGDHILLGGDNMDLALAHLLAEKLARAGAPSAPEELRQLVALAREAKERLLSEESPERLPVVLASRGARLLGATRRTELTREEVHEVALDGFFPVVSSDARPRARPRAGVQQVGLPYASDAAITRHLAAFLGRHAGGSLGRLAVLFNGGVFKANALRARLLDVVTGWAREQGADAPRMLGGPDLDLAVARGGVAFARAVRGQGFRVRGGAARAYYLGLESPAPAVPGREPPVQALCVAPRGLEEGERVRLPALDLAVVVGERVTFRFFGSSTRSADVPGTVLEAWDEAEVVELSPIELSLPAEGRELGALVPVFLEAMVTPVGTLELHAVPREPSSPGERWKIELSVRDAAP